MRFLIAAVLCLATATLSAASTNNDDSCDVAVMPAATLLLPYFEVDITSKAGDGETTIFTVTNTTNLPQAVQVTLWTDYDYPVMTFNLFLTGYDVQSINLYDVIRRGVIAPDDGTGFDVSPVGDLSGDLVSDTTYDNPLLDEESCTYLPVMIPAVFVTHMQSALTSGKAPAAGSFSACTTAGGVHLNAVGYATIDVVGACQPALPTTAAYYADLIRFDNVLGGDYMQIKGNEDFAQGSPMVHIRAIPEGGSAAVRSSDPRYTVDFDRTFYARFQNPATPRLDGRQPLPSTFAARWISGGGTGFETWYKVWREAPTAGNTACSARPALAGKIDLTELVQFDEEENPEVYRASVLFPSTPYASVLPATSLRNVEDEFSFPRSTSGSIAGWTYMNLDYSAKDAFASQNWVVSSMRAEDRFSVDIDALPLGNGCSAPGALSQMNYATGVIGPAPNVRP